jgi:hypothetical protein
MHSSAVRPRLTSATTDDAAEIERGREQKKEKEKKTVSIGLAHHPPLMPHTQKTNLGIMVHAA